MSECKRYRYEVQQENWGNKLSFKMQQVMAIIINYINPINNVTTNLYWCKVKVKLYITVPQVECSLEITIFVEIQQNYSFLSDPDTQITGSSSKWMFFFMKILQSLQYLGLQHYISVVMIPLLGFCCQSRWTSIQIDKYYFVDRLHTNNQVIQEPLHLVCILFTLFAVNWANI